MKEFAISAYQDPSIKKKAGQKIDNPTESAKVKNSTAANDASAPSKGWGGKKHVGKTGPYGP